jgi:hypothetical protein
LSINLIRPGPAAHGRNAEILNEQTAMEHLLGKLLQGDRTGFDMIEGSIKIKDGPGLQEWRGRFWLPQGSPVEPGGNYCLVRDDGRAGKLIVDRLEPGAARGDLAVFQCNSRFV